MRLTRPSFLLTQLLFNLHRPRSASAELSWTNFSLNPLRGLQQFPLSFYSTKMANMTRRAPVISISHGGGPMPLLGDPSQAKITHSLKTRVPEILKLGTPEQPKAIVLVTAHWSTDKPTISSGEKHELYYDYYGFPDEAYSLKYDAPGSPEVAELVKRSLEEAGLQGRMDGSRGAETHFLGCRWTEGRMER